MEYPIGPEVSIWNLIPGVEYYAFSQEICRTNKSSFRGVFTEYYVNDGGYNMLRFHYTYFKEYSGRVSYIGSPEKCPWGSYWRIFDERDRQSYRYYKVSRFTEKEKKELQGRVVLRERRQYERGLTGSTPNGIWFPRDLVREISLKYLTDKKIAWPNKLRKAHVH
jgi:hypothetical protein